MDLGRGGQPGDPAGLCRPDADSDLDAMMDADELMRQSAEKAVSELEWQSIEQLFRPVTVFDLLLRIDFEGMKAKAVEWMTTDAPDAMPHRFRRPYADEIWRRIEIEKFYRACKAAKEAQ